MAIGAIEFRVGYGDHLAVEDFVSERPVFVQAITIEAPNLRFQKGLADAAGKMGRCASGIDGPLNDPRGHYLHSRANLVEATLGYPERWRPTEELNSSKASTRLSRDTQSQLLGWPRTIENSNSSCLGR